MIFCTSLTILPGSVVYGLKSWKVLGEVIWPPSPRPTNRTDIPRYGVKVSLSHFFGQIVYIFILARCLIIWWFQRSKYFLLFLLDDCEEQLCSEMTVAEKCKCEYHYNILSWWKKPFPSHPPFLPSGKKSGSESKVNVLTKKSKRESVNQKYTINQQYTILGSQKLLVRVFGKMIW